MQNELKDAETEEFIIPANSMISNDLTGRFVRCLESSNDLELSFNHGSKSYFEAGIARHIEKKARDFKSFQLFNKTANDITVTVAWGYGDIIDNRLSVSSDIAIKNAPAPNNTISIDDGGGTITVNDVNTDSRLTDIKNRMTEVFRDNFAPRTNLTDASYASASNATVTLVTAGANTGGVFIRVATLTSRGDLGGVILIDGNQLGINNAAGSFTSSACYAIKDLYIPSGVLVQLQSNNPTYPVNCFYEVL